jgi:hypothetical protein
MFLINFAIKKVLSFLSEKAVVKEEQKSTST